MKNLDRNVKQFKIAGYADDIDGAYQLPHNKIKDYVYQIIASTGMGWEHVSITLREKYRGKFVKRCPAWEEMCYIKDLFWGDTETVMQLHPPKSEHVNNHAYCLHLWRPIDVEIPMPDKLMVGV